MRDEYLRIGVIVRAHGVRGAVKALPTTDDATRFLKLKSVYLESKDGYQKTDVRHVQCMPDAVVLELAGVDTREAAERLKSVYLCVDREHAVKLPEHSYFVADLIGCETFDSDGNRLGTVTDVLESPANDVYEIDGGKLLVPALVRVLASVDTEDRKIVFHADVLKEVGLFAD